MTCHRECGIRKEILSDFVGMVGEVALWEGDVAVGVGCHFKSGMRRYGQELKDWVGGYQEGNECKWE